MRISRSASGAVLTAVVVALAPARATAQDKTADALFAEGMARLGRTLFDLQARSRSAVAVMASASTGV